MSVAGLEQTLRELPKQGTRIKDRGYREIWRFEHGGRAYYLKFYRRHGYRDRFRRIFRGSPAMAEFTKLKLLQKAGIPSPRAVAALMGFRIGDRVGDAVVIEAIEPAVQLDEYCNRLELQGEPIPGHLQLAAQIRDLVQKLASAGLGHEDLHLGNLLLRDRTLYLLDGYAVRTKGLRLEHLLHLGHSVNRYATKTDLLRGWRQLGPAGPLPAANSASATLTETFIANRITGENRYFGRLSRGAWRGSFFKLCKYPRRWSDSSRLQIERTQWEAVLPDLLQRIESNALPFLKRSPSGDVMTATLPLGGRAVDVIIKRPHRRYWYRYINEVGRGSRARRAWFKAWRLVLRNLPTAWPLLVLEKRALGYVTDNLIIFERVPGPTLSRVDLSAMSTNWRDMLFRRAGRILREIEREGFAHFDAKASNWIVRDDSKLGPAPILIDVDGIRRRRWLMLGIRRLLRSMHINPQYAAADSYSLCKGYAPLASLVLEDPGGGLESDPTPPEDQAEEFSSEDPNPLPANPNAG